MLRLATVACAVGGLSAIVLALNAAVAALALLPAFRLDRGAKAEAGK
jgi:hypothetical protein